MNYKIQKLSPGIYFVATPIGNARDITLRALDVLASADVLAAEDTRSMRRLLDIHGVPLAGRKVLSYHDHSHPAARQALLEKVREGQSVAYASEAGTPLIADPGFVLAREAAEEEIPVTSAPGPSAVATALTLGGLPTDAFFFAGFLPSSKGARRRALEEIRDVAGTLVFYESPKRIAATLKDTLEVLGDRPAALCRELTKKFEEIRRGNLSELIQSVQSVPPKGEIVLLVDRGGSLSVSEIDIDLSIEAALETMSVKDAAELVARAHGLARRDVYQRALAMARAGK